MKVQQHGRTKVVGLCMLGSLLLAIWNLLSFSSFKRYEAVLELGESDSLEILSNTNDNSKHHLLPNRQCGYNSASGDMTLRLLFPHVNKAGGRTLEATFNEKFVFESTQFSFIAKQPRSANVQFQLVDGHHYLEDIAEKQGCSNDFLECEEVSFNSCTRWIFMLRDPLKRTLSAFYTTTGRQVPARRQKNNRFIHHAEHFRCDFGSKASHLMQDINFTFKEFAGLPLAERKKCFWQNSNLHSMYLLKSSRERTKWNTMPAADILELAKERLKQLAWFGIMEEFPLSMKLFRHSLGIDLQAYHPVFNQNKYEKNLSPKELEVLREMNEVDVKLYNFAKRLFYERIAGMNQAQNSIQPNFQCAKETVCWDKKDGAAKKIGFSEIGPSMQKDGEYKQNFLCAPVGGCHLLSKRIVHPSNSDSRCVAGFLITGSRKGGSTSLYHYVAQHPRVKGIRLNQGPQSGELLFFRGNKTLKHLGGDKIRKDYNDRFRLELQREMGSFESFDPTFHLTGESSVDIGASCSSGNLLKAACGKSLKFIYLVRNPVDRIISQLNMRLRLGKMIDSPTSNPVESQIIQDFENLKRKMKLSKKSLLGQNVKDLPCLFEEDYMNSVWGSLYSVHLKRFVSKFDAKDVLVVKSEDLFKHPELVLREVLIFLSLDPTEVNLEEIVSKVYNSKDETHEKRLNQYDISSSLRMELNEFFEPFNNELERLFNIDVRDWK